MRRWREKSGDVVYADTDHDTAVMRRDEGDVPAVA